jgi:hypothetical protein
MHRKMQLNRDEPQDDYENNQEKIKIETKSIIDKQLIEIVHTYVIFLCVIYFFN